MTTRADLIDAALVTFIEGLTPAGGNTQYTGKHTVYRAIKETEYRKFANGIETASLDRNFLFENSFPSVFERGFGAKDASDDMIELTIAIWHQVGGKLNESRRRMSKDIAQICSQLAWYVFDSGALADVKDIQLSSSSQDFGDKYWKTNLTFDVEYVSVSNYNG